MDVQWLSSAEQAAWRNYLYASLRLIDELDHRLNQEFDLPLSDYEILVALNESEARCLRMSDLAESVIISRSRLTYRVDRLVGRGLVRREISPEDRRVVFAHITEKGAAVLDEAAASHVADVRRLLFAHLGPDQVEQMREIFGPVRTYLEDS